MSRERVNLHCLDNNKNHCREVFSCRMDLLLQFHLVYVLKCRLPKNESLPSLRLRRLRKPFVTAPFEKNVRRSMFFFSTPFTYLLSAQLNFTLRAEGIFLTLKYIKHQTKGCFFFKKKKKNSPSISAHRLKQFTRSDWTTSPVPPVSPTVVLGSTCLLFTLGTAGEGGRGSFSRPSKP